MPLTGGEFLDILTRLLDQQTQHADTQYRQLRDEIKAVDARVTKLAEDCKPAIDGATTIKNGSKWWVVGLSIIASIGIIFGAIPGAIKMVREWLP